MLITLRGIPVVQSTSARIPNEERSSIFHYYDVRQADEGTGDPCTIEKFVLANHFGTIITTQPFDLSGGAIELTDEESFELLKVTDL